MLSLRRSATRRRAILLPRWGAAVLLSLRSTILRLALRRAVLTLARRGAILLLRWRTAVLLRRRAPIALRRTTVLALGRRCLLLRVGRVRGRSGALPTLLRVRRIGRGMTALLRIRRVRRCAAIALRWPLRRTLRHERVPGLARRRLSLAGRRVALLRWRVAVTAARRRPVTVPRLWRRVAIAITRPRRPAGRKHRAARPAPRRRPRRREDDLTSSLVRAQCTKPRRHGGLGLLVLGEGNEPKPARFPGVLVPHHDDLAQRAKTRKGHLQILLRVVLAQVRHIQFCEARDVARGALVLALAVCDVERPPLHYMFLS